MYFLTFFDIKVYHIHSIFYTKQIISRETASKSRFVIEILSNLNIAFKKFKISQIILFPFLTALFSLAFFSNLFIAVDAKLFTNPGTLLLAKGIATFVSFFSE